MAVGLLLKDINGKVILPMTGQLPKIIGVLDFPASTAHGARLTVNYVVPSGTTRFWLLAPVAVTGASTFLIEPSVYATANGFYAVYDYNLLHPQLTRQAVQIYYGYF